MKTVSFQAKDKAAKETTKKLEALVDDAEIHQVPVLDEQTMIAQGVRKKEEAETIRSATVPDVQFPTTFQSHDARDKVMAAKLALADAKGVTPFGQLIASEADFDWVERKRLAAEEANFQAWFAMNYDRQAPHIKAMARKLFPDFYEQRMKVLEKNVRLQQRVAELKLNGIQSKDDLYLQYAIESGLIPSDPLEDILHPESAMRAEKAKYRQRAFVRGLLNPRAWGTPNTSDRTVQSSANDLLSEFKSGVDAWKLGHKDSRDTPHGFSIEDFPSFTKSSKLFGKQQQVTNAFTATAAAAPTTAPAPAVRSRLNIPEGSSFAQ